MKKLKLKALSLGAREILSREQLKSITGGCSMATDCAVGQTCNQNNECEDDPNGPSGLSGFGSMSGCPTGTPECYCGSTMIGCLDPSVCESHIC
jgi:hypothetical protein